MACARFPAARRPASAIAGLRSSIPLPQEISRWPSRDRWWITYNGELYNFPELRRELESRGERFQTECDTEVLLRMYVVDGPSMLRRLNGIFAFAIWDDQEKHPVSRARSARRETALLHARLRGMFAFASEIKPLLPLVGSPDARSRLLLPTI